MDKCQLANYTALFIRQMEKEDVHFYGLFNSVLKNFIQDLESFLLNKTYYFSSTFFINVSYIYFDHIAGLYINGEQSGTRFSYPMRKFSWENFKCQQLPF